MNASGTRRDRRSSSASGSDSNASAIASVHHTEPHRRYATATSERTHLLNRVSTARRQAPDARSSCIRKIPARRDLPRSEESSTASARTGGCTRSTGRAASSCGRSSVAAPNADSAPAATASSVFVASTTNKRVYSFNSANGVLRWQSGVLGLISAPPTVANGLLYTGTTDTDKVYAINLTNGVKPSSWAIFTAGGPIRAAPAVADGSVYLATGAPDNKVIALDATTGALQWQAGPFAGANFASSPSVDAGGVFIGGQDGKLYALDAGSGAPLWPAATTAGAIVSSSAAAGGLVYVGSSDHSLYAFDEDTGSVAWSKDLGAAVTGSPAVADRLVAVSVPGKPKLYVRDAVTGAKLRALSTRADPSSPILVNAAVDVFTAGGLAAYGLTPAYTPAPDPRSLRPDPSLTAAQPGASSS